MQQDSEFFSQATNDLLKLLADLRRITFNAVAISMKIPVDGLVVTVVAKSLIKEIEKIQLKMNQLSTQIQQGNIKMVGAMLDELSGINAWIQNVSLNLKIVATKNQRDYAKMILDVADDLDQLVKKANVKIQETKREVERNISTY